MPHDREVVRDDHVRQAEFPLEVVQQVHHLGLDRHIERGDRLVGHDQPRVERERAGDTDALTLTAGELVRIAVVVLGVEPDHLQHPLHFLLDPALGLDALEPEGSADDRADGVPRVQRRVRVLEDHLHVPAHRTHSAHPEVSDVLALELDLAAGRFEQPGDQPPHRRLAAAGLAHDAQRLAGLDLEVEAVDRVHGADLPLQQALLDREVLLESGHLQQGLARGDTVLGGHDAFALRGDAHRCVLGFLAHSFGAISSIQIRSRCSLPRWQAAQCRLPTSASSGRTVRVTLSFGMSA